jgi:tetratricopeptide (TPR) repeat protein
VSRSQRNQAPAAVGWGRLLAGALILSVLGAGWFWYFRIHPQPGLNPSHAPFNLPSQEATYAEYAGAESCRDCHQEEYTLWRDSHHGLAERQISASLDQVSFDPHRSFHHGTQTTHLGWSNQTACVSSVGLSGNPETFQIERVIGHDPLRQYLVPFPGGRLQTLEASYDPRSNEWFNVYGSEDRHPGEWGHWTGRGMNWNSMCAACHNTRVRKNYEEESDTYRTAMAELTVSCESCHGPLKKHNEWQLKHGKSSKPDPTINRLTRQQTVDNCGFCHARRADLTGDFKPGDPFLDHMHLSIVDETTAYYPDGQVRDENYEFSAFLGSKMHYKGVACVDCHNPHSSKTILPGNFLCLRCHDGSRPDAPKINPVEHSRHKVFGYNSTGTLTNVNLETYSSRQIQETGGQCINCHMPQTVYMQKHWRHDHGFTIPDPQLTKEHGTPNACNRCHTDKDTDWAISWTERWYGSKMERPTRERARLIARARAGDDTACEPLLKLLPGEQIPYWRASLVHMLGPWASDPKVFSTLLDQLDHTNALVRAEAIGALAPLRDTETAASLEIRMKRMLDDPVRAVRVAAARSMQGRINLDEGAGSELLHSLNLNADQPSGQMQKGLLYLSLRDPRALIHFKTATEWDPYSPPFHSQYAAALSLFGDNNGAVAQLTRAAGLLPSNGDIQYQLGLAMHELGRITEAAVHLEKAVHLDPRHSRAWYNLGLIRNSQGQPQAAIEALARAESLAPQNADAAYARATILFGQERRAEALEALDRVLEISPGHPEAAQLKRRIELGGR